MKLRNKKTGEIGNLVLNINPNREEHNYAIIHCFMPSLTRNKGIWEPMDFEDIKDALNLLFGGED